MTARALKIALDNGTWVKAYMRPPLPPEEWTPYKQERLQLAIACAIMHIVGGKDYSQIAEHLRNRKLAETNTKQMINQYVSKGLKFLISREMFKPASK